ncbi:hypothetical protein FISHEDRAFT_27671, partial [Fistulina hepatica ATCC 64428]
VASTGYLGLRTPIAEKEYSLEELTSADSEYGFRLHEWDGKTVTPIADSNDRVVVVLAGHPDDPTWDAVHTSAAEELEKARARVRWPKGGRKQGKRGNFHALQSGITFGGGQPKPMNAAHVDHTKSILRGLNEHWAIIRIATFASALFLSWAPRLYHVYKSCLEGLLSHDNLLVRNFAGSVFAAITYNFGPRTVTFPHRDFQNLPFGWCTVTALGRFNHRKGGHLVLWDLKLVIQFPPGSTILIPSAIIKHSNVRIAAGETRYSITQYSAGGLFRWVDHGYQTESLFWESLDEGAAREERVRQEARWMNGLDLFSTLDELSS